MSSESSHSGSVGHDEISQEAGANWKGGRPSPPFSSESGGSVDSSPDLRQTQQDSPPPPSADEAEKVCTSLEISKPQPRPCVHNMWTKTGKKRGRLHLSCMVCGALWKTRPEEHQKCQDFFKQNCDKGEKCEFPHIYRRPHVTKKTKVGCGAAGQDMYDDEPPPLLSSLQEESL